MKKEVILVPKDKDPLYVLAEMKDQTKNSWIFLHQNAFEKLQGREGASIKAWNKAGTIFLKLPATKEQPEAEIAVDVGSVATSWKFVILILTINIAFSVIPTDPEHIFFLKMEE